MGPHREMKSAKLNCKLSATCAVFRRTVSYGLRAWRTCGSPAEQHPSLGEFASRGTVWCVKVCQALRASGLLPPEYRRELDSFFDRALPNPSNILRS